MKEKLLLIADEILLALAKKKISPNDPMIGLAITIKETLLNQLKIEDEFETIEDVKIPSMIETVIQVFKTMDSSGMAFSSACSRWAKIKNINESSVRAACCRRIGLTADDWNVWMFKKSEDRKQKIVTAFTFAYPNFGKYILEQLN